MERISCHLEMHTQLWDKGKNNHHIVLFYSAQHTETVPCRNAINKSYCFSVCDVKRTYHNEKPNHHFIDLHLVQLPSRKTM